MDTLIKLLKALDGWERKLREEGMLEEVPRCVCAVVCSRLLIKCQKGMWFRWLFVRLLIAAPGVVVLPNDRCSPPLSLSWLKLTNFLNYFSVHV